MESVATHIRRDKCRAEGCSASSIRSRDVTNAGRLPALHRLHKCPALCGWPKAYIVSSPDVIRGKPRVKGTRIPVRDRYEITFPNGM